MCPENDTESDVAGMWNPEESIGDADQGPDHQRPWVLRRFIVLGVPHYDFQRPEQIHNLLKKIRI